ncbi:MAG TPA: aldo/keto reductase, partial [Acidimicrobiales bacterium]
MKFAGVEVARIGLGTNQLTNTRQNISFIKAAVAAGVQLIDTAHLYTGGQSEETIGAALSPMPDTVVVATKGGVNGGSPATIRSEIDQSLRRLRARSIALYYLHRVDPNVPIETSLSAIKE